VKLKAAALMALLGLVAGPANAQPRWVEGPSYYEGVPARMVLRIVRSQGLQPVQRPVRRGQYYIVHAVDGAGQMRQVILDAYSGGIVRVYALGRGWRGERSYGDREYATRPYPPGPGRSFRPPADVPDDRYVSPPYAAPRAERSTPPRPRAGIPEDGTPRARVGRADPGTEEQAPRTGSERRRAKAPAETAPSPSPDQTSSASPTDAKPPTQASKAGKPRVILQGGPTPKGETPNSAAAAKTAASTKAEAPAVAKPDPGPAPSAAMPPVNPLE